MRAVVAGEADLAINLQAPQKAIADRSPNVVAQAAPSLVLYGAFLNYGRPPLDDVRVRQALNYAINRDEINKIAAVGLGQASSADPAEGALGLRSGDAEFLHVRSGQGEEAAGRSRPSERPRARDVRLGRSARHAAPGNHHLAARQGRHPRQADGARSAAGGAGLHDREEGRDVHQPVVRLSRTRARLYEALFGKTALRNASGIELPGFRELLDATMAAQDQAARKEAFVKLQRFVIEQALQLVQYISPAVHVANPKVMNYQDSLLAVPKLTEVWLKA